MANKILLLLPRGSVEASAVLSVAGACAYLPLELEIVYTDAKPEVVHMKSAASGDVSGSAAVMRSLCRLKGRSDLLGESEPQQFAQVEDLLSLFSKELSVRGAQVAPHLPALNERLLPRVFLTGHSLTVADLALRAAVHGAVAASDEKARAAVPCVVRWLDHVQHLPSTANTLAAGGNSALPLIAFSLAPVSAVFSADFSAGAKAGAAADNKKQPKEAKEPKPSAPSAAAAAPAPSASPSGSGSSGSGSSAAAAPAASQAPKPADSDAAKTKKEARAKDKAASAPKDEKKKERPLSKKELAALQLPIAKLELKVGRIVKASVHPSDAKLYVEEVDVGAGPKLTVVSTFADYFPLSKFAAGDTLCVVATNLEKANIKGVESTGRIFDVQKDGKKEWLQVPAGAKVGERVTFTGASGEPDKEINPKKFRELLKELSTNDKKVAQYREIPFMTSAGPCTAATFAGAKIG